MVELTGEKRTTDDKRELLKISVCIPTYNRANHLVNCLNSIFIAQARSKVPFQICVSDNGSTDHTEEVVREFGTKFEITYRRHPQNVGMTKNFLSVVEMATGDFVWMIGDDDLVVPDALERMSDLVRQHQHVDFFYVNSCHLTTEYVASFPKPFDTVNLPAEMPRFSSWDRDGELPFIELVDPKVSFDFLGGIFLAVFRRRLWLENVKFLEPSALNDKRQFSHFDNTFPQVKIYSKAFSQSQAYFCSKPFSVCLTGAHEWAAKWQLVESVRLLEAVDEYRKNGLPLGQYLRCKNYALRNFVPALCSMFVHKKTSGFEYIKPFDLILRHFWFPNFGLSIFRYIRFKLVGRRFAKY